MNSNAILANSSAGSLQPPASYEVISRDHYAMPGDEPPMHRGAFASEAEAIACAQAVVDSDFAAALRQGCTTRAGFADWFNDCGEYPTIYSATGCCAWQAGDYARAISASSASNLVELHRKRKR